MRTMQELVTRADYVRLPEGYPAQLVEGCLDKTRHLLAAGVEEVWLVDPDEEAVEVHTTGEILQAREAARLTSNALPGFTLTPRDLFR